MSDTIVYGVNRASAAEIATHLFRADTAFEPSLSSRVEIRAYAQKLHDRAIRFEAWLGQGLVGLVASYSNQSDRVTSFVTSVSVLPECQGLGIGAKLMSQCIEHARNLNFREVALEVNERSVNAILFYQKLGFHTLSSSDSTLTMGITLRRTAK
jgi:ribosomal-protein-alanine N-acetyltransferase